MKKVQFDGELVHVNDYFSNELVLSLSETSNNPDLRGYIHRRVRVTIELLPDPKQQAPISCMPQMVTA